MIFARITSIAGFLPDKIITNEDLAKNLDTSDEWIFKNTGIKQRHIIDHDFNDGLTTGYMSAKAATKVLENAKMSVEDIDAIIVATTTNDRTFPSCATYVQKELKAKNAFAFDVQAVCSGFLYALVNAYNFIITKRARHILVIGAETMSRIIDWEDRKTCILFGDGAGAILLSADDECGLIDFNLFSNGNYDADLHAQKFITMNGQRVFRHAIESMYDAANQLLIKNNLDIKDINYCIPHQANQRIIDSLRNKFDNNTCNFIATINKHANTSAASIPLALNDIQHQLKKYDKLLITAFGGGFTWGSILLDY